MVNKGGFAVVDVRDDSDVPEIHREGFPMRSPAAFEKPPGIRFQYVAPHIGDFGRKGKGFREGLPRITLCVMIRYDFEFRRS